MSAKKTKKQETEEAVKTEREQDAKMEAASGKTEREGDMFSRLPDPCVYCGPSVRGVAQQYTTYMGGIHEPLKEFIKDHPAVRALLVPTTKFAGVRRRLETPGTAEAVVYKEVKSQL